MRMADEEELDYTYEINPIREDDYIAETVVIDAGDGGSVNTGVTAVSTAVLLAVPVSLAVMLRLRQAHTKVSRFYPFAPGGKGPVSFEEPGPFSAAEFILKQQSYIISKRYYGLVSQRKI